MLVNRSVLSLFLFIFPPYFLYMVTPYQESLKLLFNTWNKVYQISARIITNETRRNSLKKLQGNYRRFQREVEVNYKPEEEITVGLLRYYQVQAERQYKYIVNSNFPLTKTQSFRHINPWVQRMENFEKNRQNRAKVELSTFLHKYKGE